MKTNYEVVVQKSEHLRHECNEASKIIEKQVELYTVRTKLIESLVSGKCKPSTVDILTKDILEQLEGITTFELVSTDLIVCKLEIENVIRTLCEIDVYENLNALSEMTIKFGSLVQQFMSILNSYLQFKFNEICDSSGISYEELQEYIGVKYLN